MSNVLQGLGFQAGFNKDIFAEQKSQLGQAGALAKQKKGGLLGSLLGSQLGKFAVDKLLGTYLKAQFGPAGVLMGKALGAGLGAWGGTKLGVGRKKDVGAEHGAGTGLLGSGYERLGKLQDSISDMARAQGLGAGVGTFVSGLGSKALQQSPFGDKGALNIYKQLGFGNEIPQGLENMEDIVSQAKGSDVYQTALGFNIGGYAGPSLKTIIPEGLLAGLRGRDEKPIYSRSNPSSYIDDLLIARDSREKALAELGGMKHADSARESEDIYQESLVNMDKGNLKSLLGLTEDAKWSAFNNRFSDVPAGTLMPRGEMEHDGRRGKLYEVSTGRGNVLHPINQPEELEPMMNPFTGEELGEAPLGPSGTFGMGSLGRVPSPYEGIADALEFATRKPDRSAMDILIGKNKPREAQEGDADRLRKLMGDENYFMLPDRKYEDEIQQLLQGFQMGGMPGTSNPIPYQDGGMALRMAPDDIPNIDYVNVDYNLEPRRNRYGDKIDNPIIDRYQASDLAGQEVRDILYQLTSPRWGYKEREKTPKNLRDVWFDVIKRDQEKMNEGDASLLREFDMLYDQTAEKDDRNRILAAQNLYGYDRGVRTEEMFEEPYLFENEKKEASDLVRKIKNTPDYKDALSEMRNEERLEVLKRLVKEGKLPESVLVDDFKQQGGYMQRYNLGGSVAQQPMSYQLGGLLKYKRNPMVG